MTFDEFEIGLEFFLGEAERRYRVTDKGTRTVVVIQVEPVRVSDGDGNTRMLTKRQAAEEGWFNGPPYALVEYIIDENEFAICTPVWRYMFRGAD